jgi:hypothetical protein
MAYQFSFDGKSLWALGGGSLVLSLLIFFAGLLLGANWRAPETVATAATVPPNAGRAQAQPVPGAQVTAATTAAVSVAELPYEPPPPRAFYDTQRPQEFAAQGYASPGGAQDYATQDYAARAYAERGYAARPAAPPAYAPQQRYAAPGAGRVRG